MRDMKKSLIAGVVLTAMSAMSQASFAEDTVTSQDVKVTASRVEQELQEVPMSISVVTAEQIKESSAKTIGDLLQDVPGVQVTNSGSQGLKRISIRGEDTFRTLVMIDGQKISEQKSMDGTAILIDTNNIERIEVIKGPASVLYGSDAIGGAINIITKKGGNKAFGAEASVGWNGAGHGWSESLALSGKVDRFQYRLSGSYQSQENLDTPEGRLPHTAFRTKTAGLFLSYDITDNITAGIQADTFDSHLRSGSVTYDPENFYVDIPEWKRNKVGVFVDAKDINDYLTRVRWDAYWQKTEKQMHNYVYESPVLMDSNADNRLTTIGTSVQTDWQLGEKNYLIAGYEFSRDELEANTTLHMQMMSMIDYTTDRVNKAEQSTHAVFAAMETTLPYNLKASYGARYSYVSSEETVASASKNGKSMGGVTYTNVDDGSAGQTGKSHNSRVVFNAGLTWTGIEDWALRATWAQGFRAPLLQEKYIQNNMGGGTIVGNPDLKPETSNTFEFGARYNKAGVNFDIATFYSMADNYITTEMIDTRSSKSRYINADEARTFGIELGTSWTIADHYTPYLNLTVLRRTLESSGYRSGVRGEFKTHASGSPAMYARYGVRTSHELWGGTLKTDTYGRSQSATESYTYSTDTTTRLGGFTTLNFTAGYSFGKDGNYSVNAEFLNIFNKLYQYNTSTYEAGRHFNVKFNARY